MRRKLSASPILLAMLLMTWPGIRLSASAERSYAEGRAAVADGRWDAVVELMMQAIESEPHEKKRALAGPYIPHYFLGLGLYELGDCQLALQHLRSSRRYRVVLETRFVGQLESMEESCVERLARLQEARREIAVGERLAGDVEERLSDPALEGFWSRGLPPPALELREAQLALQRAEGVLDSERAIGAGAHGELRIRSVGEAQISQASAMVQQITNLLQDLERRADEHLRRGQEDREALRNDVLSLRMELVRAWNSASVAATKGTSELALESEYQRLTRLHLGDSEVTVDQLQSAQAEMNGFLDKLEALPRKAPQSTPAVLREAARAYFAGDYEGVLTLLEGASFRQRRAQAQTHLFRGAALYALYLIGDRPDPELLRAAKTDVERCHEASSDVRPMEEAFSPRFVEFFQQQISTNAERTALQPDPPGISGTR